MSVTITDNSAAWFARLDRAIGNGLTSAAMVLADTVVREFGSNHGGYRSAPGMPPNSQSGELRNSIGYTKAEKGTGAWKAVVGSSLAYPAYLNDGATIKPKNTKMLMIPLTREAERGVRRFGSPRGFLSSLGAKVRWVPIVKGRKYLVIKAKPKPGAIARSAVPTKPSGQTVSHSGHVGPAGRKIIEKGEALFLATVGPVRIDPRPWAKPALTKAKTGMEAAFRSTVRREMGGHP